MFLTRCQQDYVRFNAEEFEELGEGDGGRMSFTMMATGDRESGIDYLTDWEVAVFDVTGNEFSGCHSRTALAQSRKLSRRNLFISSSASRADMVRSNLIFSVLSARALGNGTGFSLS